MVLRYACIPYALLGLAWLWVSCSIFDEEGDDNKAKEPKKSTATGKTTGVDDDGLSCEDSDGFRMIWGFPADAVRGKIDLALFEDENYHFTATWYAGEAATPPDTADTAKIVGYSDPDMVLEFDLNDMDVPAAGGFGAATYKEVTVIIKGKASKLYLCDADDSKAGGMQDKSSSFNSSNSNVGNAKLLKVVMSPLCWENKADYRRLFKGCGDLKEVSGKIDAGMTSFNQMFEGLMKLKKVDVSAWDTSSVVNMQAMFKDIGTTGLEVKGLDKLNYSSLAAAGSDPYFSQGMVDMFSGTKLDLPSFKGLLFGLLTKSPSADPHLNAGESSCDDSGATDTIADTDENCCKRAQHKLVKTKLWSKLTSGDDLTVAPYSDGVFTGIGTCTIP